MSISKKTDPKFERAYDRAMLRSAVASLFWGIISERKKQGGFTFQELAKKIGSTKHELSRWFNGDPNWTLNTVASIANALDVELRVEAVDRSKRVYRPYGIQGAPFSTPSSKTESESAEQPFEVTRAARAFP
jgi:transcriptional regulator with XRE-family HTH domain